MNDPKIVLVVAAIFIISSPILHSYKRFNVAIILLVLGGFLLRVYVSLDIGLHEWDERFHALVAKNLIKDPLVPKLYSFPILDYEYKNWLRNYIWLHKPPLALWLISFCLNIFGIHEFAVRIPSILLTSFSIYTVYFIGHFTKDKNTGYLAAFLFSINGFIVELAGGRITNDHIDSIFTSLFLLCIFLSIRLIKFNYLVYSIIVGLSLAAALLTKWLIAFFVIPLVFIVLLHFKLTFAAIFKRIFLITISALVFALPWHLYIHFCFPNEAIWESTYNFMHVYKTIEAHESTILFFLDKIRINYHDLIYLPLLWFISVFYKNPRDNKNQFLLIWFLVPLVFFSLMKTKMPGYLEFTAASYLIIVSIFWFELYNTIQVNRWIKYLMLTLLIVFPIKYSMERIKPYQNRPNPEWVKELKELGKKHLGNYVLLNYKAPIEAMFYTDLIVYSYYPTQEMVDKISEQGYHVLININEECDLEQLKKVTFIQLSKPDQFLSPSFIKALENR